jgi:hypothetical protein
MKNKPNLEAYKIIKSNSSPVNDIFNDVFDITWHQKYFNEGSRQRTWGLLEGENSSDDGTVTYVYNDDYFRCDNFTDTHGGRHILFAGCSETEGEGGNVEDAWANILFQKINNDRTVSGYFNVGKASFGWQKVITQTRIYISKYGKPDNLFILLPNIGRSIEWSEDSGWFVKQKYPSLYSSDHNDSSPYVSAHSPKEYRESFVNFSTSWKLFEDFCMASGINFLWGTWEEIDNYNFDKTNIFNNFVPLYKDSLFDNLEAYRKDSKTAPNDLEKRDGHHGRLFHEFWAESMLQEARKRGFLND